VRALILIIVLAGSAYEVFYGPSRDLNVVAAIILAIALFSVRKHYRVSYGAIEIAFGLFVLAYNWRQGRGAFSSDFSSSDFDVWIWQIILLQTFTAIYVIIRGLDNIDQGSQPGKAAHPCVLRVHAICRGAISIL
jgi:hypothetical protein